MAAAMHAFCLLAVAAMAAACGGGEPTAPTVAAVTPTPIEKAAPAATPTQTAAPAPTRTPSPTATVAPTYTPTPTASPTPTATPTPTPDPLARFSPLDPAAGAIGVTEALIAGQIFRLEVAATPEERAHGLMGRAGIPDDFAMLFVYHAEAVLSFWMKGTLIPLDILFLDSRGVVVDVQTMTLQPGASDGELKAYESARPARYALEMNAGLAESLGVAPGAAILFD